MSLAARRTTVLALLLAASGCGGGDAPSGPSGPAMSPAVLAPVADQAIVAGQPFSYDAAGASPVFSDPRHGGLSYSVAFSPAPNGLVAAGSSISGVIGQPGVTKVTITATDTSGAKASNSFRVVAFAAGLTTPVLPATSFLYSDAGVPRPNHFLNGPGNPSPADNTPADNQTTDAGATLGRVLFYDTRLSANDHEACGSCHLQSHGFSDTARVSAGFLGGHTARHSMGLSNARYYQRGRFFWDERAITLEDQALRPIQDATEMGMKLDDLEAKLALVPYYPALFQSAFGTPQVTRDRISRAIAQFVRSLASTHSRYDQAFASGPPPNFAGVLTAQEVEGLILFGGSGLPGQTVGCDRCHGTITQILPGPRNNGLEELTIDPGAGNGQFKAPSLRNVAVRAPYMHDGRFTSLLQVVTFYNAGVQPNANLDQALRTPGGQPVRFNLSAAQLDALVAFLGTLTDSTFLTDARFADPFPGH
jgi:cytochrome c peroxidase